MAIADTPSIAYKTTPGTGETSFLIAADDLGASGLVQRVKVQHGADGSGTDVSSASPMPVTQIPSATDGLSISRVISAASTNATSAKASAGKVYGWYFSNINAAARYLKLYNKASAPTVGTDVPVITLLLPGNTAGACANVALPNGITFGTGIAYAITTGVADADTGAVAANELVVNLFYK